MKVDRLPNGNYFVDVVVERARRVSLQLTCWCHASTKISEERAYQILLTLPVSSAGVERSFSKLAYIKSKLRTTMGQERLESLMFTAIEKDILVSLPRERLVSKFTAEANRRIST